MARYLWNLSPSAAKLEFKRQFPDGFPDPNIPSNDMKIYWLEENLTSEHRQIWQFMKDAAMKDEDSAEDNPQKKGTSTTGSLFSEKSSNIPKELKSLFRQESRKPPVPAESSKSTLHLTEAIDAGLEDFRPERDDSWLTKPNESKLLELNQASYLGITPEKIAERKSWGNQFERRNLVSESKPVQPVDLTRFQEGKYSNANLPLETLLTKEVSLQGLPKRASLAMRGLVTLAKKTSTFRGRVSSITSANIRRVQHRVFGEQAIAHDTMERTFEVLLLMLPKDPHVQAYAKQILRSLNINKQSFEILKKIEDLPQRDLSSNSTNAKQIQSWLTEREKEYPLKRDMLNLQTEVPGFSSKNIQWRTPDTRNKGKRKFQGKQTSQNKRRNFGARIRKGKQQKNSKAGGNQNPSKKQFFQKGE